MHTYMYSLHLTNPRCSLRPAIPLVTTCSYVVCVDICVCVLVPYMQGANQNAASASGGSVVGERLGSDSVGVRLCLPPLHYTAMEEPLR